MMETRRTRTRLILPLWKGRLKGADRRHRITKKPNPIEPLLFAIRAAAPFQEVVALL